MKETVDIIYAIASIITFLGTIKAWLFPEDNYDAQRQTIIITLWVVFILLFIAQVLY